jgi:hypothetical protein
MSAAISGIGREGRKFDPGFRFAHPGYESSLPPTAKKRPFRARANAAAAKSLAISMACNRANESLTCGARRY